MPAAIVAAGGGRVTAGAEGWPRYGGSLGGDRQAVPSSITPANVRESLGRLDLPDGRRHRRRGFRRQSLEVPGHADPRRGPTGRVDRLQPRVRPGPGHGGGDLDVRPRGGLLGQVQRDVHVARRRRLARPGLGPRNMPRARVPGHARRPPHCARRRHGHPVQRFRQERPGGSLRRNPRLPQARLFPDLSAHRGRRPRHRGLVHRRQRRRASRVRGGPGVRRARRRIVTRRSWRTWQPWTGCWWRRSWRRTRRHRRALCWMSTPPTTPCTACRRGAISSVITTATIVTSGT